MVSFCLSPSLLIYSLYTQNMPGITGEIIASVPLIIGAVRLARFNIDIKNENSNTFQGLPTPMNALSIASIILFIENIKLISPEYSQPRLLLPLFLSLSYLMVSHIEFAKFPILNFYSGKQNTLRLIGVLFFILMMFLSIFIGYSNHVLTIFISYYILIGVLKHIVTLGNVKNLS